MAEIWHRLWEVAAIAAGDVLGGDVLATAAFIAIIAGPTVVGWHKKRIAAGKRGVEPSHLILAGYILGAIALLALAVGHAWKCGIL